MTRPPNQPPTPPPPPRPTPPTPTTGAPRFAEGRDRLVGRVEMGDGPPHPMPGPRPNPPPVPTPPPPLAEFPPPGIEAGVVHDVPRDCWPLLSATCRTWPTS